MSIDTINIIGQLIAGTFGVGCILYSIFGLKYNCDELQKINKQQCVTINKLNADILKLKRINLQLLVKLNEIYGSVDTK